MPGELINYRWELREPLAQSPELESWRALDRYTEQPVVVRRMRSPHLLNPTQARVWMRRLNEQRAVPPPGAPAIVDSLQIPDGLLAVREWVDGLSLSKWLSARHSPTEALRLGVALLRTIEEWQSADLHHGALHPGNIILTEERPVFTDYDHTAALAEAFEVRLARPDLDAYVAPDVRGGGNAQPGSDVYSVGAILYEALTGRRLPLFAGERERVSAVVEGISPGIDLVMEGMLKQAPGDRYPARQAAEALAKLRELSVPQQARPAAAATPQSRAAALAKQQRAPLPTWINVILIIYRLTFSVLGAVTIAGLTVAAAGWGFYRYLDQSRPSEVIVPDVTTWQVEKAKSHLEDELGLRVTRTTEQPNEKAAAGTVVLTVPAPGRTVREGREVTLMVSSGPVQFTVPRLLGDTLHDARIKLGSLRLKLSNVRSASGQSEPKGRIVRQEPQAGKSVSAGTGVNVWLAESGAPAPSAATAPAPGKAVDTAQRDGVVRITVPADRVGCWVKVAVTDSAGPRILYNKMHSGGDTVTRAVSGKGPTTVEVYLDDVLEQKKDL